ncbi:hypothetical protein AAG906_016613 [Vitis piasezkii]
MSTACIIDSGHDIEVCLALHHGTDGIWCSGIFQVEDLGQSAGVHRLAVVQLRALFILIMVIIRVIFHFVESTLHDDIWIMMREWFDYLTMLLSDCRRTLMIITKHRWELSHDFRGVAMTMLDGCQSLVLVM